MATGLFPTRQREGGPRRGYIPKNRRADRRHNETLDRFAEALSEHGDVARAAATVGKNAAYGRVLLQRIIKALGTEQCQ